MTSKTYGKLYSTERKEYVFITHASEMVCKISIEHLPRVSKNK